MADTPDDDGPVAARRAWMGLLARAEPARLAALMPDPVPAHEVLRAPETGAVMVRGRTGATGMPFNLGEMTVTRCALRLATGEVGHALVQGRDRDHARNAALVDALMLSPAGEMLRAQVLEPLEDEARTRAAARAAAAAETKVDFFTLVRGED